MKNVQSIPLLRLLRGIVALSAVCGSATIPCAAQNLHCGSLLNQPLCPPTCGGSAGGPGAGDEK
jgi:hypothetical protein